MSKVLEIKDALVQLVSDIQYKGESAFHDVVGYYADKFEGYPASVVLLNNTEADFGTVAQNDRIDVFDIHIIVLLEDLGKDRQSAQNYIYELLDLVRDAIDKSQDLSGLVVYMNPVISDSGIIDFGAGEAVDAVVSVQVRHVINIWK